MPSSRSAVPARAWVLLLILTLVWGTNWPLFPLATKEVSVWTFRGVALLIAGPLLLLVARLRGQSLRIEREHWGTLAMATLFYLLLWNIASTYAAILIPSGQAAILGFTMPLWLALISWAVLGEELAPRMLWAIGLGAGAVGLLIYDGAEAYALAPLGFFLGLLAGVGWAVGTLILKRRPVGASALVISGWQLTGAGIPTAIAALALAEGGWFWPSWTSVLIITYIAVVPMSVGNAAWFAIVGMLPANVAGLSSILVPVVAMISGALVHGEPLGPLQWGAVACCVGGLSLALLRPKGPG
ncbi:MAG: DMT family transporter [Rubrivivax sp.]|nr:DMT family transporter [Rubrivivax sp.]